MLDDFVDGDVGTEIVAWYGDVDAVGVQPAGEMAEERTIERLPVAAMNEDDDWAGAISGKEIDPVTLARTIGNTLNRP